MEKFVSTSRSFLHAIPPRRDFPGRCPLTHPTPDVSIADEIGARGGAGPRTTTPTSKTHLVPSRDNALVVVCGYVAAPEYASGAIERNGKIHHYGSARSHFHRSRPERFIRDGYFPCDPEIREESRTQ